MPPTVAVLDPPVAVPDWTSVVLRLEMPGPDEPRGGVYRSRTPGSPLVRILGSALGPGPRARQVLEGATGLVLALALAQMSLVLVLVLGGAATAGTWRRMLRAAVAVGAAGAALTARVLTALVLTAPVLTQRRQPSRMVSAGVVVMTAESGMRRRTRRRRSARPSRRQTSSAAGTGSRRRPRRSRSAARASAVVPSRSRPTGPR